MKIEKTGETYTVTDSYTYNDSDYSISGSINKGNNNYNIWLSIGELGNVSYNVSDDRTSFNVDMKNNIDKDTFITDMYSKISEIHNLEN